MIGVTVGVGTHRALAEEAARRFREHTGLEAVVLTDEDYDRVNCSHPALLRTYIFDLIGRGPVTYFDADLWFCRMWSPETVFRGELTVVRDITYSDHIIEDSVRLMGTPPTNYFNSGLMIMNQDHAEWLQASRIAAEKFILDNSPLAEQTALNMMAQAMEVSIDFIDRRYNWMVNAETAILAGIPVIGAHKWKAGQTYEKQLNHDVPRGDDRIRMSRELFTRYAGHYIYERVGFDRRPLELRVDGTIGRGSSRLEWNWRVYEEDGQVRMLIGGYGKDHKTEIDTATLSLDGSSFEGRWNYFEKMPVKLVPGTDISITVPEDNRAAVLGRLLRGVHRPRVVEIGVYKGETSAKLLELVPDMDLIGVDVWKTWDPQSAYYLSGDFVARQDREKQHENFLQAIRNIIPYGSRARIRLSDSALSAKRTPGRQFDLVFIDGDHSKKGVTRDIEAWWPRVKPGGILAGHDYDYPSQNGSTFGASVKEVVDTWSSYKGLELHLESDYVWWARK